VRAARELGPAPTIAEDQDSFVAHAALKVRGIAAWLQERGEAGETLVLADDSGVCVDALDGKPGVDSAVFAGTGGGRRGQQRGAAGRAGGARGSSARRRITCACWRCGASTGAPMQLPGAEPQSRGGRT
jgi:XTP/dITP diphosphohydrolase